MTPIRYGTRAIELEKVNPVQDSFHLMYLFLASCGVLAIPAVVGLVAVLLDRE